MKKLFTYGTDYRFGSRGSDRFPQPFPRCCRLRYQTARKGAIVETVTATGTITPISNIDVGTQVSGRIQEIFVDYNSQVQKGSCWP